MIGSEGQFAKHPVRDFRKTPQIMQASEVGAGRPFPHVHGQKRVDVLNARER